MNKQPTPGTIAGLIWIRDHLKKTTPPGCGLPVDAMMFIESIIKKRVLGLENCFDILDHPIQNGAELWERGEQKLIDEMYSAITESSTLSEGARKK